MAKHTVVLQVRCTYEISAGSYKKALLKAIEQLEEDGICDVGDPDSDLKDVHIDEIASFLTQAEPAFVPTKPMIVTDLNNPLYTPNQLTTNS